MRFDLTSQGMGHQNKLKEISVGSGLNMQIFGIFSS